MSEKSEFARGDLRKCAKSAIMSVWGIVIVPGR